MTLPLRHPSKDRVRAPTLTEKIQLWTDIAFKAVSVVALLLGGCWAIYQFRAKGGDDWVVNFDLATEVTSYEGNQKLLVVHITAKNPANGTEFEIPHEGHYVLKIRRIPNDLKVGTVLAEDSGEVVADIDLLKGEEAVFLPGAELQDTETIVVPASSVLSVSVEIDIPNHTKDKSGKPDYDFVNASRVIAVGS